ncbi:hypothetical protein GALMADRAFT_254542 [Galerina marginata CBS 339.88]|uniref:Secreted protein n=1 Tax=Galerina marginata (strain CBS 339.88) TaxID=685588 RepID=A0A067SW30_GALM3|nr:hypothetical protein GALMADRAFT_254542 [Galerina marginata CBS 339.88]
MCAIGVVFVSITFLFSGGAVRGNGRKKEITRGLAVVSQPLGFSGRVAGEFKWGRAGEKAWSLQATSFRHTDGDATLAAA